MTTLEAIRDELEASTALTALVGTRIYPQVMAQGAAQPAIVITVVSEEPANSFTSAYDTRLLEASVQVDVYAKLYAKAHEVADLVDQVLSGQDMPDLIVDRDNRRDLYDDKAQLHRVSLEFTVFRGA